MTVVEAWNRRWATPEGRAEWTNPHPAVQALIPELKARGARTALDLGCGVGRHALHLAAEGFAVEAIDGSAAGVAATAKAAKARGLPLLTVRQGFIDELPFPEAAFDYVLSWNVIYHGTLGDVGRRLAEIWRVLTPRGLYQGTMLPRRNSNYGQGRLVAPDTFVGVEPQRSHPHFYCDAAGLVALFVGFELLSLTQRLHRKPGSWHWHIVAERSPD